MQNNANDSIIIQRREMVAQLLLRKLTQREIALELARKGIVNPTDGAPFSAATINQDVKALKKQWQASALATVSEWKAQLLAELEELKRAAYAKTQLNTVRAIIADQRAMLGIDAPTRFSIEGGVELATINQMIKALQEIGEDPSASFNGIIEYAVAKKAQVNNG